MVSAISDSFSRYVRCLLFTVLFLTKFGYFVSPHKVIPDLLKELFEIILFDEARLIPSLIFVKLLFFIIVFDENKLIPFHLLFLKIFLDIS